MKLLKLDFIRTIYAAFGYSPEQAVDNAIRKAIEEYDMSKANEKQVAGTHYQSGIQHWDFVVAANLGYFEGQVTKYVTRWRKKNGVQDLQKAQHFLEKLIEVSGMAGRAPALLENPLMGQVFFRSYCESNSLTDQETQIVWKVAAWENRRDLQAAATLISGLVAAATQPAAPLESAGEPTVGDAMGVRCAACHHPEVCHAHGGACMASGLDGKGSRWVCTCHGFTPDDGSAPGAGYVNQDR